MTISMIQPGENSPTMNDLVPTSAGPPWFKSTRRFLAVRMHLRRKNQARKMSVADVCLYFFTNVHIRLNPRAYLLQWTMEKMAGTPQLLFP